MLAVKLAIVALVFWFIRGTLVKAWNDLGQEDWELRPAWLIAAAGLYLLGLLPAGLYWFRLLRVLGQDVRIGETLRAYYIGHLGKYVPGKAMVVILRAGLIRSRRVSASVAAASVFFETLTMMAVGACLAAGVIAVRLRDERVLFWLAVGLAVVAGLPTLPPVFGRLARKAGVGRADPAIAEKLARLDLATLLEGWAAMVLVWLMLALSLWATFRAMGLEHLGPWEHWSGYLACVSLSMVAGFLSLIPGGLGVRDGLLLTLVARLFDVGALSATVASALLRLIWLLSELVLSGILYGVGAVAGRVRRPPDADPQ